MAKLSAHIDKSEESASDSSRGSWQTSRQSTKKYLSYGRRLTLAFAGTAAMTVVLLVSILAYVWEGEFQKYTRANMERVAQTAASALAEQYEESGGWTEEVLEFVSSAIAISEDAGIQIMDEHGTVIYDDTLLRIHATTATTPSSTLPEAPATAAGGSSDNNSSTGTVTADADQNNQEGHTPTSNLEGNTPTPKVSLTPEIGDSIASAPIEISDGTRVGTVRVWVSGSNGLLTKSDAAFRSNSYGAIWTAAIISVIIASYLGSRFARTFAKPVNQVTRTAAQIRSGDLSARTNIVGEDEVGRLGETFDSMAERVEKDAKLERRLTSDVAHELRTPLMAMLATVEAMQDGVLETNADNLDTVRNEVKRMSRLVDAMLQLSRLENGTAPFDPRETEMVNLVSGVVSAQEQLFASKDIRIHFEADVPRKECYADVDRDMIRQALTNLLSNAFRYTSEEGWVLVKLAQDRQDVLISVQDTGMGIAKEDLSSVFSRFWRSDASRARESGGLGVGLAVTNEIVDRHKGHISVESELGKGTTFTLHIPRTQRPEEREEAESAKQENNETDQESAATQEVLTLAPEAEELTAQEPDTIPEHDSVAEQ